MPPAVTRNDRAFRVLVRNSLFHRVKLAAARDYHALGELDAAGWDAESWADAIGRTSTSTTRSAPGSNARGPALLIIDEQAERWVVRQILDDPADDHDWGIDAEVDLAGSDEAGTAVVHIVDVGRMG